MGRGHPNGRNRQSDAAIQPLLVIPDESGVPAAIRVGATDYVGYYRSPAGRQLVFLQRPGEHSARLYVGSPQGWKRLKLTGSSKVLDGQAEAAWAFACLEASADLRPERS